MALPPCPFCGETHGIGTEAVGGFSLAPDYAACCWRCFARGPLRRTPDEARLAWTTRSETAKADA